MIRKQEAIFTALILTVLSLVAIISVTYAWLGVSRIPFISDVALTVITENGMFLAPDEDNEPGEWDTYLDASAFLSDIVPLKPVTYTSEGFCKIQYDETGRTNGVIPLEEENINVRYPDENHSSAASIAAEEQGYMAVFTFWARSDGNTASITLTEPKERSDGQMGGGTYAVGRPVWSDSQGCHIDGGYGTETTLRMAFECIPMDYEYNQTGEATWAFYEPNADVHPDGSTGYVETYSVDGGSLIPAGANHIIQNASTWEENSPALQDTVIYHPGAFTQNTELFQLGSGLMKIRLYIWMEGQDEDCIARNVVDAVLVDANIQFASSGESKDTGITRR